MKFGIPKSPRRSSREEIGFLVSSWAPLPGEASSLFLDDRHNVKGQIWSRRSQLDSQEEPDSG